MTNDPQKGSTLKTLQQKIGERFDERFVNPENTGYRVGQEFLGAVESFISVEVEAALQEFAEAVKVDDYVPNHSALCATNAHPELIGSCSCDEESREDIWNSALAEQEEKIKRFFD